MAHIISDLYPEIRRYLKGCPEPTMTYALQRAQREFCRETWIYQQSIQIPLVAYLDVYQFDLTDSDEVLAIKGVQYNFFPLQASRPEDVWVNNAGTMPYTYIFEPPNLLMIKPVPTNTLNDVCVVRLVLQPKEGTTNVPEVIYRSYKEYIAAGAAAYCMNVPGESWSNPQLAQGMQALFIKGINEAKQARMFGHVTGSTYRRPRSFLFT